MPKSKRLFEVWVEVPLRVRAFDASSARRKASQALRPHQLDEDVAVGRELFVHDPVIPSVPERAAKAG